MTIWFDILLLVLATVRLMRLLATDDLGYWWVIGPAERWAIDHDSYELDDSGQPIVDTTLGWRSKLVSGLTCGFCVGFWITGAVVASWLILSQWETGHTVWTIGAGILAVNYVQAHVNALLD